MLVKTDELTTLRKHLIDSLQGGHSHIKFEEAIEDFPLEARGRKLPDSPHTAWELVEHMRIAQRDILDFSHDPKHKSPSFPQGYWPQTPSPSNDAAWDRSIKAFLQDQGEFADLLQSEDLFTPFQHGEGQNLLREATVLANHNSYHLGQLVLLKRMLTGA